MKSTKDIKHLLTKLFYKYHYYYGSWLIVISGPDSIILKCRIKTKDIIKIENFCILNNLEYTITIIQ